MLIRMHVKATSHDTAWSPGSIFRRLTFQKIELRVSSCSFQHFKAPEASEICLSSTCKLRCSKILSYCSKILSSGKQGRLAQQIGYTCVLLSVLASSKCCKSPLLGASSSGTLSPTVCLAFSNHDAILYLKSPNLNRLLPNSIQYSFQSAIAEKDGS